MSLLDPLIEADLITPPLVTNTSVPTREIWICGRTDGGTSSLFGSGTVDDPFDGSTAIKFDAIMSQKVIPWYNGQNWTRNIRDHWGQYYNRLVRTKWPYCRIGYVYHNDKAGKLR
jgi:hypothetical protein